MRTLILMFILASWLDAQSFQRNDITFSGGMSWSVGGNFQGDATPVSLGATYGHRVTPSIELEAGVFGAIKPVKVTCGYNGCFTPDSGFVWVPFGVRLLLPLRRDRFEVSGGAGGLYENFRNYGTSAYSGFGAYVKASAAVAIDRHRHFWLGATPRIMIANGIGSGRYARDRWFMLSADFGFRF